MWFVRYSDFGVTDDQLERKRLETVPMNSAVNRAAPQHELPPVVTRSAASPYFCRTTSLMSLITPRLQHCMIDSRLNALFWVQHSAYKNWKIS